MNQSILVELKVSEMSVLEMQKTNAGIAPLIHIVLQFGCLLLVAELVVIFSPKTTIKRSLI